MALTRIGIRNSIHARVWDRPEGRIGDHIWFRIRRRVGNDVWHRVEAQLWYPVEACIDNQCVYYTGCQLETRYAGY